MFSSVVSTRVKMPKLLQAILTLLLLILHFSLLTEAFQDVNIANHTYQGWHRYKYFENTGTPWFKKHRKNPFNHEKSLKLGVLFIDYMSDFVIQGHFCNKNQNKLSFPKQFNYLVFCEKVIDSRSNERNGKTVLRNNSAILSYIFNYAIWMLEICSNSLNRGSPVLWKYPRKH